jgi:RHS repeat-associated protein
MFRLFAVGALAGLIVSLTWAGSQVAADPVSAWDIAWAGDGIAEGVEMVAAGTAGRVFTEVAPAANVVSVGRRTSSGAVDAGWGSAGVASATIPGTTSASVRDVVGLASGGLIALVDSFLNDDVYLVRFDGGGEVDPSFGVDGVAVIPEPVASWNWSISNLVVGGDGTYWLDGFRSPTVYVVGHVLGDGAVDVGFGGGGWLEMPGSSEVRVVVGDGGGRVVVQDRISSPASVTRARRFLANGTLDASFTTISVDPGSEIHWKPSVAGGFVTYQDWTGQPTPSLHQLSLFDSEGLLTGGPFTAPSIGPAVDFDVTPSGVVFVTVRRAVGNEESSGAVYRFLSTGLLDATWGQQGVLNLPVVANPIESGVLETHLAYDKVMFRIVNTTIRARRLLPVPIAVPPVDRSGVPVGSTHVGDPVDTAAGNFYDTFVDLPMSVFGLTVFRAYNSADPGDGSLGDGWRVGTGPEVVDAGGGSFTVIDERGTRFAFAPDGQGGFITPPGSSDVLSVDPAVPSGGGVLPMLRRKSTSGVIDRFDTLGRLIERINWDGQTAVSSFDGAGRLSTVTSSTGLSVLFSHDGAGRLSGVSSSTGRAVGYLFGAADERLDVTDEYGGVTRFNFTLDGWVESIVDPAGVRVILNQYDVDGRVVSQIAPNGGITTFSYGTDAVTTVWDSLTGTTLLYHHDQYGKVVAIADAFGMPVERLYDDQGNAAGGIARDGRQTTAVFDANDNLLSVTADGSGTTSYTYDVENRVTSVTDESGAVTTYAYEGAERVPSTITDALGSVRAQNVVNGLVVGQTDADGVTTSHVFDAQRRLVSSTDGLGNTTTHIYDAQGRRISTTTPTGRVTSYAYTPQGRLVSTTAPDGGVMAYTYDAAGRVLTTTDQTGAVTTNVYEITTPQGPQTVDFLVATIGPDGVRVDFVYDENSQLISTTIDGVTSATEYGPMGRVNSTTGPLGRTSSYTHDSEGRTVETTDPTGATTGTVYDPAGRVASTADPAGRVTSYVYDDQGRVLSTTAPGGATSSNTYDLLGRTVTRTDPRGGVTTTTYTPGGRVASVTNPAGLTTTYGYDAAGRRTTVTAPGNRVTTTVFNDDGQPVTATSPGGQVMSYTYDPTGRVASMTDPTGVVTTRTWSLRGEMLTEQVGTQGPVVYTYAPNGNMVSVTDPLGRTTTFGYDNRGNMVSRTNPLGGIDTWVYNAANELIERKDPLNRSTTFNYDDAGRVIEISDPSDNGPIPTPTTITYNPDGTIATLDEGNGPVAYTYDTAGRVASITGPDGTITHTYNTAGDVLAVTSVGRPTSYTYDQAGRRTSMRRPSGESITYTYNPAGQLAEIAPGELMADTFEHGTTSPNTSRWTITPTSGATATLTNNGTDADVTFTTPDTTGAAITMLSKIPSAATSDVTFSYQFPTVDVANAAKLTAWVRYTATNHYRVEFTPGAATATVIQKKGAAVTTLGTIPSAADTSTSRVRVQVNGTTVNIKTWAANTTEPATWTATFTGTITTNGTSRLTSERLAGTATVLIDDWTQTNPTAPPAPLATYTYNPDGQVTTETLTGGSRVRTYTNGQLTGFNETLPGLTLNTTLTYDTTGRVASETTGTVTTTYTYDQASQLLTATPATGTSYTWTYDQLGRRLTERKGTATTKYVYDAASQLCWTTTGTLPANANCNNPTSAATIDTYDPAGRLLNEYRTATNNTTYTYDPAGRLNAVDRVNGTTTTSHERLYNQTGHITQINNERTTPTATTVTNTLIDWDTQTSITQPSAWTNTITGTNTDLTIGAAGWAATRTGITNRALATNPYGSVIPNTGTTTIARAATYNPYGTPTTGTDTFDPRLGYRGETHTDTTIHLRARTYQPTHGRFTTTDPLEGIPGTTTLNTPYQYTNNNPLNLTDPTGLQPGDDSFSSSGGLTVVINSQSGPTTCSSSGCEGPSAPMGEAPIVVPPGFRDSDDLSSFLLRVLGDLTTHGLSSYMGQSIGKGACGEYNLGLVTGFSGQGCLVFLYHETGIVGTIGGGFSSGSGSAEVGSFLTNAQDLDSLRGRSICLAGSGGVGPAIGAQICAGIADGWDLTGTYSVFLSVGAALQPGASVQLTLSESYATKLFDTPDWLRPLLGLSPLSMWPDRGPELAPGPENHGVIICCTGVV